MFRHQLHAIGGFTPLLLHRPGYDPLRDVIEVLEQDTILTEEPCGEGLVADVHASAAYLQRLISGSG